MEIIRGKHDKNAWRCNSSKERPPNILASVRLQVPSTKQNKTNKTHTHTPEKVRGGKRLPPTLTMANEPYCFLENYHSLYDVRNTNGLCFLPLKERQRGWSNGSAVQELNGLRHPCGSPQQSPEYPIPSSNLHVYQTCSYYIYKHT